MNAEDERRNQLLQQQCNEVQHDGWGDILEGENKVADAIGNEKRAEGVHPLVLGFFTARNFEVIELMLIELLRLNFDTEYAAFRKKKEEDENDEDDKEKDKVVLDKELQKERRRIARRREKLRNIVLKVFFRVLNNKGFLSAFVDARHSATL